MTFKGEALRLELLFFRAAWRYVGRLV